MTDGSRLLKALSVDRGADAGDARRLAVAAAAAAGLGPDAERAALVATELATNLSKYAVEGRLLVKVAETGGGVEIVATDRGPGMRDARARMVDGFSTGGSLGGGLGAVARLSDVFDLHSVPAHGTVVASTIRRRVARHVRREPAFLTAALAEPHPGELVSGDDWAVEQDDSRLATLVADGLGHGPGAAEVSAAAVECFRAHHRGPPDVVVAEVHRALRGTRGAAVAIAELDRLSERVRFCGVGNIVARLVWPGGHTNLTSQHGIAGFEAPRVRAVEHDWPYGAVLVLHSDGLSSKWSLDRLPGLTRHHPMLTAAVVLRDAVRHHDDATVLAAGAR